MKRLILFLIIITSIVAFKNDNTSLSRSLEGYFILTPSSRLKVQFKIYEDSSAHNLSAKMTVPAQALQDYPIKLLKCSSDSLIFTVDGILKASYAGRLVADSIVGVWNQLGKDYPLTLRKSKELIRPQNPTKPYPYKEEEVVYCNKERRIRYSGTLTLPNGNSTFPAVIMITGSGQEDRDETLFGHKPFWVIADFLTRRGIAVLRVDDRGIGRSTGDVKYATSEDFSKDVLASIDYLKTRPEINKKEIGLIGHSEGGLIALLAAGNRNDVRFIVSLAGVGVKGKELYLSQVEHRISKMPLSSNSILNVKEFYSSISDVIISEPDNLKATQKIREKLDEWIPRQDSLTKVSAGLIYKDGKWTSKDAELESFLARIKSDWMRYFLSFNPKEVLAKVNCPILVLNGEKDMQVFCNLNMNGFKSVSKDLKKVNMDFCQFPELNHFFQHCKTGEMDEYVDLEETFAPEVLNKMYEWIDCTIKEP